MVRWMVGWIETKQMDKKWTIGWIKKMDGQNHGQKQQMDCQNEG